MKGGRLDVHQANQTIITVVTMSRKEMRGDWTNHTKVVVSEEPRDARDVGGVGADRVTGLVERVVASSSGGDHARDRNLQPLFGLGVH
jgi:hypothetical protein